MDDGLDVVKDKEAAQHIHDIVCSYSSSNDIGIKPHERKTHYQPMSVGFNYLGWRYNSGIKVA